MVRLLTRISFLTKILLYPLNNNCAYHFWQLVFVFTIYTNKVLTLSISSSIPSQKNPPSAVSATFVKMEFFWNDSMALGLVFMLVPGATPKNPFSGLMALRTPLLSNLSHAMSSPKRHKSSDIKTSAFTMNKSQSC